MPDSNKSKSSLLWKWHLQDEKKLSYRKTTMYDMYENLQKYKKNPAVKMKYVHFWFAALSMVNEKKCFK